MNKILVISTDKLYHIIEKKEFGSISLNSLIEIMNLGEYKVRNEMETTPEYKQIIPYIMIRNSANQILCYKRSTKGAEKRLHEKLSIGVGGHIEEEGEMFINNEIYFNEHKIVGRTWDFFNDLVREVHEEIGFKPILDNNLSLYGYINDNNTDVGKVHLGIVFCYDIDDNFDVKKGETDILINREFLSINEINHNYTKLEEWSKILFDNLLKE